uniref:C2H2-type domain-containing protein n=1 Tax=Heterorhabditis bacteriophora TaxID=37862 RepID=A0A1I7XII4_HETBA
MSFPSSSDDHALDSVMDPECMYCQECGQPQPDNKRLYHHLFMLHGYSKQRIDDLKRERRFRLVKHKAILKSRNVIHCEVCAKPYLSKAGLVHHKQREHGIVNVSVLPTDNIVCPVPECGARFVTYIDLASHADQDHRDEVNCSEVFRIHRARFPNQSKFEDWRMEQERQTCTQFFTRSTETKIRYGKKAWLLKCTHTQKRKKSGRKADQCPAFMRICERFSGEIEVVACFGHLGHPHHTESRSSRMMVINNDKDIHDYEVAVGDDEFEYHEEVIVDGDIQEPIEEVDVI